MIAQQRVDRVAATRRAAAGRSRSRSSAIGDQLGVARGDGDVALRQHHVHVRQQRLRRTATRGTSPAAAPGRRRGCAASQALTAAPKPYQPGSISRHCAQLNTQGIARRSSIARRRFARGRAAADVELGDLADHRRFPEVALEARRLVDQVAIGAVGVGRQLLHGREVLRARRRLATACSSVASSVAAARISRLRRPTSGLEYLPAITSPCSVMRIAPCTAPPRLGEDGLVARAAAAADRAAAAVEQAQA